MCVWKGRQSGLGRRKKISKWLQELNDNNDDDDDDDDSGDGGNEDTKKCSFQKI